MAGMIMLVAAALWCLVAVGLELRFAPDSWIVCAWLMAAGSGFFAVVAAARECFKDAR